MGKLDGISECPKCLAETQIKQYSEELKGLCPECGYLLSLELSPGRRKLQWVDIKTKQPVKAEIPGFRYLPPIIIIGDRIIRNYQYFAAYENYLSHGPCLKYTTKTKKYDCYFQKLDISYRRSRRPVLRFTGPVGEWYECTLEEWWDSWKGVFGVR